MLAIIATEKDLVNNEYIASQAIKRKGAHVTFKRPNGNNGWAKDVAIVDGSYINDFSLEYLVLEFLRECNVRCGNYCYVSAKPVNGKEPTYIDFDFTVELARQLNYSPSAGWREICITGGEPTLDMLKLQTRVAILNEKVPNKHIVIATNLLAIPHSEHAVGEFFARLQDAQIQASYNPFLAAQYQKIASGLSEARYEQFTDCISHKVKPENALLEKLRLFDEYAHKYNKVFRIRVNGVTPKEMEEYKEKALAYLGTKGRTEDDFMYARRVVKVGAGKRIKDAVSASDSRIRECSDYEEIYMCSNGALYPTVNHIDNISKRIGTLVLLNQVQGGRAPRAR